MSDCLTFLYFNFALSYLDLPFSMLLCLKFSSSLCYLFTEGYYTLSDQKHLAGFTSTLLLVFDA